MARCGENSGHTAGRIKIERESESQGEQRERERERERDNPVLNHRLACGLMYNIKITHTYTSKYTKHHTQQRLPKLQKTIQAQ